MVLVYWCRYILDNNSEIQTKPPESAVDWESVRLKWFYLLYHDNPSVRSPLCSLWCPHCVSLYHNSPPKTHVKMSVILWWSKLLVRFTQILVILRYLSEFCPIVIKMGRFIIILYICRSKWWNNNLWIHWWVTNSIIITLHLDHSWRFLENYMRPGYVLWNEASISGSKFVRQWVFSSSI